MLVDKEIKGKFETNYPRVEYQHCRVDYQHQKQLNLNLN